MVAETSHFILYCLFLNALLQVFHLLSCTGMLTRPSSWLWPQFLPFWRVPPLGLPFYSRHSSSFWKISTYERLKSICIAFFFLLKLVGNVLNLLEKWIWTILYQLCEWKTPADLHWADTKGRAGKINRQHRTLLITCC